MSHRGKPRSPALKLQVSCGRAVREGTTVMVDGARVEGAFIYDAFISYRHVDRDRQWAEWLINALELYRVPKALQRQGFPTRLRKVFRDEDEIPASSDLND